MQGEVVFGIPNLCGWSYRLCTGTATTMIIVALVGAEPIVLIDDSEGLVIIINHYG